MTWQGVFAFPWIVLSGLCMYVAIRRYGQGDKLEAGVMLLVALCMSLMFAEMLPKASKSGHMERFRGYDLP